MTKHLEIMLRLGGGEFLKMSGQKPKGPIDFYEGNAEYENSVVEKQYDNN